MHFYKEVSNLLGNNFTVDKPCPYCLEENRHPPIIVKNKNNYVRHVGPVHEMVLRFAPSDMVKLVQAMASKKTVQSPSSERTRPSIKKENVINLPDGLNVISASNPRNKQFPSIPSGLKITKSKKILEGVDVLNQVNIGSNLKIERVSKGNSPPILPCGECDYKAESMPNLKLHMQIHKRAAGYRA